MHNYIIYKPLFILAIIAIALIVYSAKTGTVFDGRVLSSDNDCKNIEHEDDECQYVKDKCGHIFALFNYLEWYVYCCRLSIFLFLVAGTTARTIRPRYLLSSF